MKASLAIIVITDFSSVSARAPLEVLGFQDVGTIVVRALSVDMVAALEVLASHCDCNLPCAMTRSCIDVRACCHAHRKETWHFFNMAVGQGSSLKVVWRANMSKPRLLALEKNVSLDTSSYLTNLLGFKRGRPFMKA